MRRFKASTIGFACLPFLPAGGCIYSDAVAAAVTLHWHGNPSSSGLPTSTKDPQFSRNPPRLHHQVENAKLSSLMD